MSKSPPLPEPITISLWRSGESKTFERPSDILDWLDLQKKSWRDVKLTNHTLKVIWTNQQGFASRIEGIAKQVEEHLASSDIADLTDQKRQEFNQNFQRLKKFLNNYSTGENLSTEHPYFAYIQALAETDPDAAASLLLACSINGSNALAQAGALDAIARIGPGHVYLDKAKRNTIRTLKAELSKLRTRADEDLAELRALIDQETARTNEQNQAHSDAVEERKRSWTELTESCHKDWAELKRIYDEKLALLAPTEYWRDRSKDHRKTARNYAIAFSIALVVFMAVFGWLGITHLTEQRTDSVVLAILPVLIPAFAGIWVLRILGRLLSENLMIAQDAHERETMVKTFLALMRDETTGKEVITDEDRRIILHALFRPSAVTATDDAPPLHWAEALRPKS